LTRKLQTGNYITKLSIILAAVGILFSCSKRTIGISESIDEGETTIHMVDFQYLSIRSKLLLTESETKEAVILTRMKKDSVIWFNVSGSMGIQGLRAILTTDSVKILDRVTKEYSRFSYEELSEKLNFKVDFNLIQSLIVGNVPQGTSTGDKIDPGKDKFTFKITRPGITVTNQIHSMLMKPERILLKEDERLNSLTFDYSVFELADARPFPMRVIARLIYDLNGLVVEEIFDAQHTKVEFSDKPLKFPFNVPNKYDSR
jgi:hypothetical protein